MGFFGNLGKSLTGGLNVGPSAGASFMHKLGGQIPGMINGAAQKFGAPSMGGAVKGAGSMLGMRHGNSGGMGMPGQNVGIPQPPPPSPMPIDPGPMGPGIQPGDGIDTGPSMGMPPMTTSPIMGGSKNIGNGGFAGGGYGGPPMMGGLPGLPGMGGLFNQFKKHLPFG